MLLHSRSFERAMSSSETSCTEVRTKGRALPPPRRLVLACHAPPLPELDWSTPSSSSATICLLVPSTARLRGHCSIHWPRLANDRISSIDEPHVCASPLTLLAVLRDGNFLSGSWCVAVLRTPHANPNALQESAPIVTSSICLIHLHIRPHAVPAVSSANWPQKLKIVHALE